jgi:hypothetical protein
LAEALGRAGESNKRLGEVLLDLEFISNDILKDSIRYQVQQTVSDLASWGDGEFEYRDCSVEFEDRSIEKIDITGLILEATRRVDESKRTFTEVSTVKKAREYARAKVSWPLSILTVQGPLEGEVRDISLTGAAHLFTVMNYLIQIVPFPWPLKYQSSTTLYLQLVK